MKMVLEPTPGAEMDKYGKKLSSYDVPPFR